MPITIKAKRPWWQVNIREIIAYRELLFTLVSRDIKVRYKQTFLGIVWVILQPLLAAGIFTLIFSNLIGTDLIDGVSYGAFVLCGFIFWQFFSTSVTTASGSVAEQIEIIKKVYFPRVYFPMAVIGRCFFDFLITFICLIIVFYFTNTQFYILGLMWSLLVLVALVFLAHGLSFLLSALNVKYRDVRHILPFFMQVWLYTSPVFYPDSILPESLSFISRFNPIAVILNLIRQGIFHGVYDWVNLAIVLSGSFMVLLIGLIYFKNSEKAFADIA
ncbi:MAG: ABC transporter permease [Pseudomonadales bacterium]|jgi:lipopolysaccharide transport system permease protein|nr:ABC transporter permease [Pseudomonadales bacterium]